MRKQSNRTFYSLVLSAVAVAIAFNYLFLTRVSFHALIVPELNKLQEKELDTFLEMNRLLTTLATGVLGGTIAIVSTRYGSSDVPLLQMWRIVASWVFCGLSLYCGYVSYGGIVWMLHNSAFDLTLPKVVLPQLFQFWSFVVAIFFFADFVYRGLGKRTMPTSLSREKSR